MTSGQKTNLDKEVNNTPKKGNHIDRNTLIRLIGNVLGTDYSEKQSSRIIYRVKGISGKRKMKGSYAPGSVIGLPPRPDSRESACSLPRLMCRIDLPELENLEPLGVPPPGVAPTAFSILPPPVSEALPIPQVVLPLPSSDPNGPIAVFQPPHVALSKTELVGKECNVTCVDINVYNRHMKGDVHLLVDERKQQNDLNLTYLVEDAIMGSEEPCTTIVGDLGDSNTDNESEDEIVLISF